MNKKIIVHKYVTCRILNEFEGVKDLRIHDKFFQFHAYSNIKSILVQNIHWNGHIE